MIEIAFKFALLISFNLCLADIVWRYCEDG